MSSLSTDDVRAIEAAVRLLAELNLRSLKMDLPEEAERAIWSAWMSATDAKNELLKLYTQERACAA